MKRLFRGGAQAASLAGRPAGARRRGTFAAPREPARTLNARMARRHLLMLLVLSGIWGGSYLLNEIALRDLEPAAVIFGRFLFGALALASWLLLSPERTRALAGLRDHAAGIAVVAVLNAALPFFLIAWGQQFVDSGLTGILVAASPLFTALVALRYARGERVTGLRLTGVCIGFVGVAVLLGIQPASGTDALFGALAIVGAALSYSVSGLYIGARLAPAPRLAVAVGTTVGALVLTTPLALAQPPDAAPSAGSLAAVVALGVVGTGLAYVLYFALIGGAGASRAILVNYLIPAMAVLYGATLLDEEVSVTMLAGLGLVLGGVALGTGALARRASVPS
jgi:drug/metabolite transporter (DMT)-like permease